MTQVGPPSPLRRTPSGGLPVLPALDQIGVFAQHSFHFARLLRIHAGPQHGSATASWSRRAAQGPGPGAGAGRPGPSELRRGRVGLVGPGMRAAECLVHLGDGTAEKQRRWRGRKGETGGDGGGRGSNRRIQQRISGGENDGC